MISARSQTHSEEGHARAFRARILKPTEGVFLFHPRAIERLVAKQLGSDGYEGSIPELGYALMPCADFLHGLETENPEALAVIEGLDLPDAVILLPIPPEQRRDRAGFVRLLRDYWARRFEAEVARAWQLADTAATARTTALIELVGPDAFAEIREVLGRDGLTPNGIADTLVCRAFVALLARLYHFAPGARGFLFPAILDWALLDAWLASQDLAPDGRRLTALLARTRPDPACGEAAQALALPSTLPYGATDPGLPRPSRDMPTTAPSSVSPPTASNAPPPAGLHARCLAALEQGSQLPRGGWAQRLRDWLLNALAPLLAALLALGLRFERRSPSRPTVLTGTYLMLFRHAIRMAQRAELNDRYALTLWQLVNAERLLRRLGQPRATEARRITATITRRVDRAQQALGDLIAVRWKLPPHEAQALRALIARLVEETRHDLGARPARAQLRMLEQVLREGRTTYYRLQPLRWALSWGRRPLRQILPFQSTLKALHALDAGLVRLDGIGWTVPEVERFAAPLRALSARHSARLQTQLRPHLEQALTTAGFTPRDHRERVAAHKLLCELLDVIEHRRHLRFTEVRDIVARNTLRLPDPGLRELLGGDRLARFDRAASRALPGVYKPGEIYIKGLQQLSAPLFGTPGGRLLIRHLLLPLGLAFLGLKTLDLLVGLLVPGGPHPELAPLWLIAVAAVTINLGVYTEIGRHVFITLWHALGSGLRLLLFDGLRRLLRWRPVANLLATRAIRALDHNLLRPLLTGALALLPFIALASLAEGHLIEPGAPLFGLAFTLGILINNTPLGRRLVDQTVSTLGALLRRLNQTLVIGLVKALLDFFKEFTRRFQQGLHRIEELLSHHLTESVPELLVKSLLAPLWNLLQALIQFYVTVLVEPQVNPIKHFPLVTIAHKLLLPFLPAITGVLVTLTESVLPKLVAYPFVTLTVLLLPGLAGFLVWELKENWKIYAANHPPRTDLHPVPEPAVVGAHGENMRAMLRRGIHSGTLPKAFDRLRRALRDQLRDEQPAPWRVHEAQRRVHEIEQAIQRFGERELAHALRLRGRAPHCRLARVETLLPRLATQSCTLHLALTPEDASTTPILIRIEIALRHHQLCCQIACDGPVAQLERACWRAIAADIEVFAARAAAERVEIALPHL
ncbi:sulfite exporter TauE/SafE family protein [Marichromatium bheemlicum]|uniref:Sulfite exporter TauE/SafE family protein n=1 Tax=Marichromatium bheemlicum TaxID=365339 RepID=A0ABX1I8R8_9GAMM|nr:sulfite exporter TauE/SafE family protein [Marichromatium bheemlicum]NKN33334.1 sulfite exporter TauE/SafE family protein [Marichromatium bheemlicum]